MPHRSISSRPTGGCQQDKPAQAHKATRPNPPRPTCSLCISCSICHDNPTAVCNLCRQCTICRDWRIRTTRVPLPEEG